MSQLLSFAQLAAQFQKVNVGTLLWLRKTKANKAGTSPIYLRIFIGPDRIEHSTGIRVTPDQWDAPNGRIVGKGKLVQQQNEQLQLLKAHVPELVNLMKATGRKVTISSLRRELIAPQASRTACFITICQQASESRDKRKPGARSVAASALSALTEWHGREKDSSPKPLLLEDFTPRLAAAFYHWLLQTRKASTANGYVGTLTGLFRYAAQLGEVEIAENPFRALRKEKGAPVAPRLHLTTAQIDQLRLAKLPRAQSLARDIYLTQYYLHGSRVGAVLQLRWQDIGPQSVWLQVEKGGQAKAVALSEPLREVLARQTAGAPTDLVFPALLGAGFFALAIDAQYKARSKATNRVNGNLAQVALKLGIVGKLHSHTARHTLAGHAAELGGLAVAKGMLGHTNEAMTARYAGPQQNAGLLAVERALYGADTEPTPPPTEGGKVLPLWKGGAAA